MISIALAAIAIAIVLVLNELWWKYRQTHREHSRKLIHIVIGSFAATWPYYMSWQDIRIMSILFLLVVIASKLLNIFPSIHEVERFTLGEICFALAVGVLTFMTKTPWIYAVSLLQMSLADGLAAIVGLHYGNGNRYKVFGATKSLAGTGAFIVVSFGILLAADLLASAHMAIALLMAMAVIAAAIENVAVYGLDNILLPLGVALMLLLF